MCLFKLAAPLREFRAVFEHGRSRYNSLVLCKATVHLIWAEGWESPLGMTQTNRLLGRWDGYAARGLRLCSDYFPAVSLIGCILLKRIFIHDNMPVCLKTTAQEEKNKFEPWMMASFSFFISFFDRIYNLVPWKYILADVTHKGNKQFKLKVMDL